MLKSTKNMDQQTCHEHMDPYTQGSMFAWLVEGTQNKDMFGYTLIWKVDIDGQKWLW